MHHGPAGMATDAVNMHIPSPIISATEQVHVWTRCHHVNAASSIHITDTSRQIRQHGDSQKKGRREGNSFGFYKMLYSAHNRKLAQSKAKSNGVFSVG